METICLAEWKVLTSQGVALSSKKKKKADKLLDPRVKRLTVSDITCDSAKLSVLRDFPWLGLNQSQMILSVPVQERH